MRALRHTATRLGPAGVAWRGRIRWSSGAGGDLQRRILEAAVPHVPALGWSADALAAGATDAGLSAAAHGQVDDGAVALVAFVADRCADELRAEVDARAAELASLDGGWRARLAVAVDARVRLSLPSPTPRRRPRAHTDTDGHARARPT